MTHRGPFQPLLFCDSVILWGWTMGKTTVRKEKGNLRIFFSVHSLPSFLTVTPCSIYTYNWSLILSMVVLFSSFPPCCRQGTWFEGKEPRQKFKRGWCVNGHQGRDLWQLQHDLLGSSAGCSGCLRQTSWWQGSALFLRSSAFTFCELPHQYSCVPALRFFSTNGSSKQPCDSGWISYWNFFNGLQLPKRAAWRAGAFNSLCLVFNLAHIYKAAIHPEQPYAPCFVETRQAASSIFWPTPKWYPTKKLPMVILGFHQKSELVFSFPFLSLFTEIKVLQKLQKASYGTYKLLMSHAANFLKI